MIGGALGTFWTKIEKQHFVFLPRMIFYIIFFFLKKDGFLLVLLICFCCLKIYGLCLKCDLISFSLQTIIMHHSKWNHNTLNAMRLPLKLQTPVNLVNGSSFSNNAVNSLLDNCRTRKANRKSISKLPELSTFFLKKSYAMFLFFCIVWSLRTYGKFCKKYYQSTGWTDGKQAHFHLQAT